jgi:hypothetical protein
MSRPVCDCGHEKRDHVLPAAIGKGYGSCKVCLCNAYIRKDESAKAESPKIETSIAADPAIPANTLL